MSIQSRCRTSGCIHGVGRVCASEERRTEPDGRRDHAKDIESCTPAYDFAGLTPTRLPLSQSIDASIEQGPASPLRQQSSLHPRLAMRQTASILAFMGRKRMTHSEGIERRILRKGRLIVEHAREVLEQRDSFPTPEALSVETQLMSLDLIEIEALDPMEAKRSIMEMFIRIEKVKSAIDNLPDSVDLVAYNPVRDELGAIASRMIALLHT
jgi:hypothetical protein